MSFTSKINYKDTLNILSPAKAAFYSAVLPGLGQAYNRQYWKVPLVYVAIGSGAYFYIFNNNQYQRFRTAYFNRQNGVPDEFPIYSENVLIDAQKFYRRQRDTAFLLTVLAYVLNVLDANISAHLKQWNVSDDLSIQSVDFKTIDGIALGFRLNINLNKK